MILWLCREIPFSDDIKAKASANRVELRGYVFDCAKEHTRAPRIVRVGAVQNAITTPTDRPVSEQVILFFSLLLPVYNNFTYSCLTINRVSHFCPWISCLWCQNLFEEDPESTVRHMKQSASLQFDINLLIPTIVSYYRLQYLEQVVLNMSVVPFSLQVAASNQHILSIRDSLCRQRSRKPWAYCSRKSASRLQSMNI